MTHPALCHSSPKPCHVRVAAKLCSWLVGSFEFSAVSCVQAKDALHHPYFDDQDRVTVDALENPELEAFEDN